ncbi:MAG: UxaA family hydrolase [Geminicoccaceae bacterium]
MAEADRRLLVLDPADNVAVACRDLEAGTELLLDGSPLRLEAPVPTGHKLARRDIAAGEKVLKYGAPIGSARCPITRGSYVHTHNLESDYIPTWARDGSEMR